MEKRIETKADEMLMRLRREKKMNVLELQAALGVDRDVVDQWISIFEAHGLVELVYPPNPVEPPYVVIKDGQKPGTAKEV